MTTRAATETSVLSATASEPGQLVEVRRRQWIVSNVDASAGSPELPKRNLVKLASIDEDALGEEIEVLWELEPGAHAIERAGLPSLSALDDPSKLEAFLDAARWGAATSADQGYLQAPFRRCVSIKDYQLVRAIDMVETIFQKRGLAIAKSARERGLGSRAWIRKFARMDVQRLDSGCSSRHRAARNARNGGISLRREGRERS